MATIFPKRTGMVHVSGVVDQEVSLSQMRDPHRVLVTHGDQLNNFEQIAALQATGYAGPISYEAFAPEVHARPDPEAQLAQSFATIRDGLAARAA